MSKSFYIVVKIRVIEFNVAEKEVHNIYIKSEKQAENSKWDVDVYGMRLDKSTNKENWTVK